jgi:hypothetical protein
LLYWLATKLIHYLPSKFLMRDKALDSMPWLKQLRILDSQI